MNRPIVSKNEPITLVGGAPVEAELLVEGLHLAPKTVAADGGAKTLLTMAIALWPSSVI